MPGILLIIACSCYGHPLVFADTTTTSSSKDDGDQFTITNIMLNAVVIITFAAAIRSRTVEASSITKTKVAISTTTTGKIITETSRN